MPFLSNLGRKLKLNYFLGFLPREVRILEIGAADGWLGRYLKRRGWDNYIGLDLSPPAEIIGDVRDWKKLGLESESFDVIFAFEVLEHVVCFKDCFELLKPGGLLMVTTPVPHMDWVSQFLEKIGLIQRRTSPHDCLFYFKDVPFFQLEHSIVPLVTQWGVFRKPIP